MFSARAAPAAEQNQQLGKQHGPRLRAVMEGPSDSAGDEKRPGADRGVYLESCLAV